ncbi:CDP-glycerol glycerophosphotransferase family protein [Streptomyces sp. NBC_01767]|uniref:CDP-glycerol glycerophosphotransferase family protein n=1 Tax=Streptomyces sp. NBC_01767 TaxID=2975937 RepID=UPI00224EC159|nr:CDP-glycerol glycerophosphotransferase family protein [Streptomyces sp. NBC_01767]MCX4396287.1 bifunctional glycosyltransferase family 2 protein/CDP-glycerol:glycerophosphate glycerophosphotransferase [Streptomyces sp. NBC_01767]
MKPRLSVVVPVHNVEDHLEDCLRSVAGQSVGDIEVVLVDDGSTDGSTAIAKSFAAHDRRFRYVRRPNGGPGAARNTGVRHTTPDVPYLAFVDSDDVVVHDGYARMLASLESTGSDLATGNVWQLTEQGRQQARQYHWLTGSRARTHIGRDPRLLADRVAWNKVFRRSFWDRHAFAFPEGRLSEDIPVTIPAHYLAGSVDVLHEHVHYWRVREGSIARRRTDVKGVRDRIAACEQVSAFLAGRGGVANGGARRRYDLSCLRDDFVYFLDGLPMGGPEYREAFMADAGAFLDRMERMDGAGRADRAVAHEFPVSLRIKWQLVKERRLPELLEVLAFERANGAGTFTVGGVPGRRQAGFPGIPDTVRLARTDLPAVARLLDARWGDDGKLRLRGYAYIRNLPATTPRHSLKMGMVRATQGQVLRTVPVRGVLAPEATADSGQQLHRYDHSGFEMTLDPRRLRPGGWMVGMMVAAQGTVRRVAVRAVETGAAQPLVHDLGDGRRAVLDYRGGRLRLTLTQLPARCESHRFGTDLELTGRLYEGARPKALVLTCEGVADQEFGHPVECRPDGRFTVRIPLADLAGMAGAPPAPHRAPREVEPEPGGRWRARLVLADGTRVPLAVAPESAPPVVADAAGELVLDLSGQPFVEWAAWTPDGALRVEGVTGAGTGVRQDEGPDRLVLRHEALRETVSVPVTHDERGAGVPEGVDGKVREGAYGGRRFTAFLAPSVAAGLCEGRWEAYLGGRPVRVPAGLAARLPLRRSGPVAAAPVPGREFALDRRSGDRLTLWAGPVAVPAERGAFRRAELRGRHYPSRRAMPLRNAVLYTGGDSPRAVHTELLRRGVESEHLWVTDGVHGGVPPTAVPVIEHSAAWYEALARSRRIVTADQLPEWFERRPDQTVVQTWHGAPLGRFGADLAGTLYADHQELATLPHRSAQWSVLVSPSRHTTPLLRRALDYRGEILEAGSPANDLLFSPDRAKTAERVRRRLGIPDGRRVVLYAPTYRDQLAHPCGADDERPRYRWDTALDPAALARSIGSAHTVLVRRHPRVTGSVPERAGVRDVSAHPDTAELLLIADVLVTDYAGLMFDFAHTGRPMLFHTYDLAHYRDTVRGFCLDFENRAPGPLLARADQIAALLRDAGSLAESAARHADAYESFRRDFCDLDDGGAAARVADRLLAAG